jgi:hypothetical protein
MNEKPTKIPPKKATAVTKPRELHVYEEGPDKKGIGRYRVVIREVFLGRDRIIREFPVHENHLERLKLRYCREFRVPNGNVFFHSLDEQTSPSPGSAKDEVQDEKTPKVAPFPSAS